MKFDLNKKLIPKLNCDVLLHAAAITPQNKYSSKEFDKINFQSLKEIIKNIKINKELYCFRHQIFTKIKNII